jgi:hypothetical protein
MALQRREEHSVVLGIVLLVLSAAGAITLAGVLITATDDGALAIAGFGTVSPPGATAVAAIAAAAVVAGFLVGLHLIREERKRRNQIVVFDQHADEAAREARARLLSMRLKQLGAELEQLESRREAVLHRSTSPHGTAWHLEAEPEDDLVVVPDVPDAPAEASEA